MCSLERCNYTRKGTRISPLTSVRKENSSVLVRAAAGADIHKVDVLFRNPRKLHKSRTHPAYVKIELSATFGASFVYKYLVQKAYRASCSQDFLRSKLYVLAYLVAAHSDAGTDRTVYVLGTASATKHCPNSLPRNVENSTAPSRMRRTDRAEPLVSKENRRAVRALYTNRTYSNLVG